MRSFLALFSLLLLVGCGSPSLAGGSWHEQRADGTSGLVLEFDRNSNRMAVHLPNKPDGSHDHASKATYTYDEANGAVTMTWSVHGKTYDYQGTMQGDSLDVKGTDGSLRFGRSDKGAH
ncbi:MAG: hypothetical protein VYE77_07200 [Planctomycetota bacterium]|nr:hypothetical protein [Planctomycetota bacterium]